MPVKTNTPSEQRRALIRTCNLMLSGLHNDNYNIYEQMTLCIYAAYSIIERLEGVDMMPTAESIYEKLKVIA